MPVSGYTISFRPISTADVPNLVRWQMEPEIAIWWNVYGEDTVALVTEKWIQRTDGTASD
tara:strand:+ start:343 stop:522 length:180 start_codon:yes stop_codon:yes gene_type:complete